MELFGLGLFVLVTILLALGFDFVNGFHDSANAIATVVATRVLTPLQAVSMAAFFNFVGPFVFSLTVAATVGKGIIDTDIVTTAVIFAALIGSTTWDLITWWLGLPTSSSHALVGGLIGAGWAAAGVGSILWPLAGEWSATGEWAVRGLVGGAAFALVLWPVSRLGIPFGTKYVTGAVLAAVSFWYYQHTFGLHVDTWKDVLKTVLHSMIWLFMGFMGGALVGIMVRRPSSIKYVPLFALIGAFAGIAVGVVTKDLVLGGLTKTLLFMIVSPFLGFFAGFFFGAITTNFVRASNPGAVNSGSRRLQLASSAFYALTHGTNDAQKTMGIIAVLLFSAGALGGEFFVPTWVIVASAAAIGLGTFFGGWRIVHTLAARVTNLRPLQGFAAETAGGVVLAAMAEGGIPVSTTHAITTSIMGVGSTKGISAVHWGVGRKIIGAWVITIPASALIAAVSYWVVAFFT